MKKPYILIIMALFVLVHAYNILAQSYDRLNPPYPRTAMFNMVDPTKSLQDGVRHEMLKDYDMVMIYGMTDFGGHIMAPILRAQNPNQILFASGINGVNDRDPVGYFMVRSYRGVLKEDIVPNQEYITVSTTADIHAGQATAEYCYVFIGDDLIKVRSVENDTTLRLVVDNEERFVISTNHFANDTLFSPLRSPGPGIYPDFGQYAKTVDGIYAWDYIAEENYYREVDWASGLYDGMYHDFFTYTLHIDGWQFDIDRNGVPDEDEHSSDWYNEQWRYGARKFVERENQIMAELTPTMPNLLALNAGGVLFDLYDVINGHQFEGFQRFVAWDWFKDDGIAWMNNGKQPLMMSIFDYFPEKHFYNGKNRFNKVRFGLTASMMFDMYYGYTGGDTYWLFYWYDEFETNMGYPTGPYSELSNGLLVRYFDNGVAICNPTGADQTLTSAMLTGGPYYRLKGGQDPVMNNGELFTEVSLYGYDYGIQNLRGDGILLFKEPTTAICDIIVDNFFLNSTSPGSDPVELTGSWTKAVSAGHADFTQNNPYWGVDGTRRVLDLSSYNYYYDEGYGYHYCSAGSGENTATWKPTIGVEGWYEVSEWHGWHGDAANSYQEATNVPFEMGVDTEVRLRGTIDQQSNIGQWNRLGYLYLPAGKLGYVKITNEANGYVIVDAMKFTYMGDSSFTPDSTPPAKPTNVQVY